MATEDLLLPLLYSVEVGGATYRVKTIAGDEALSRPHRFEVVFHVEPHDALDPDTIIGGEAVLVLARGAPLRRVRCVVTRAERGATRRGNAGAGKVTLVLESRLSLTRFRVDIRIFRDKTVPTIVTEVLEAHGLQVESHLAGTYVERHYCVQMRESDLDFASRLLEDEGIFYVVDDEGRVLLGDYAAAYLEGPGPLWFGHDSGLLGQRDAVYQVGWAGRATAGKVSMRDFNPEKPRLHMEVSAKGPTAWGPEWYDYPGEYEVPALGQIKVDLRAEALACEKRRLAGRSTCARLSTGVLFSLLDAPAGVDDGEYVVTKLKHAWDFESSFSLGFEALPSRMVYRPPVVTYVPTFPAPLTGFVTGPAGADIYTDPWGRVKVHFQWDRLQPLDDHCSYWIPVLQDNTGRSSSMPRIGWEVLCQFLEGDPDRPVVLGRVFNPTDPFTEELPTRKMRITLQSLTSPRSKDAASGYNMIRFDDLAGAQTIDIHAQKDQNIVVANDQDEKIDSVEAREIKGNETIKIGSNETIDVTIDSIAKVDGNQTVKIGGDRTIDVTGRHNENVEKDHTLEIGGDHTRDVHTDDNLAVTKNLTELVSGSVFEQSEKNNILSAGKTSLLVVGGSITEMAQLGKSEGTQKDRIEMVSGTSFSSADEKHAARTESSRTLTVGGGYMVTALKEILLAGLDQLRVDAADISFTAPSITLKVGETTMHLKSGRIDLNAPETITIDTQQVNNLGATTSSQNRATCMDHQNYAYRILHRPASYARALVNGIPIYDRVVTKNVAPSGLITHWLLQGENTLTIELAPAPRSPLTPYMGPHFALLVLPADDLDRTVFHWEYPDTLLAHAPPLPVELPLVHVGLLHVAHELPIPAYRRGSPEDFPVEGTPAQHAAVAELYEAFARRDPAAFEAAMELKTTEFERFYGPQPMAKAEALQRMNAPWQMDPFDGDDLRFYRYLDGRVAHVQRLSGRPAVHAVNLDDPRFGWGTDFFMTRLDGRWRIFW